MHTYDTIIRAGIILTQDDERRIIHNGAVAVTAGLVAFVGPQKELPEGTAEQEIDLSECLILPGLINAHTHAPMTLLRGLADDVPLMPWLEEHVWPVERKLEPDHMRIGTLLACAEMIRTGQTAMLNGYFYEEHAGYAARQAGMRMVLGEGFFDFPSPMFPSAKHYFDEQLRLLDLFKDDELIRTSVCPHAPFTVGPENLAASHAFAREHDIPWQTHLAESPEETETTVKKYGKRPVMLLHDLGILDANCTLHHCVDINAQEVGIIAESGASVSNNPSSNMKLCSGLAPVRDMLAAGIPVGLGTDGACSNNQLNLFREIALAALNAKVTTRNAKAVRAQDVLDMATRNSAACLHWQGLGQITQGGPADMAALDLTRPNMAPLFDPVSQAVYAATGHENVFTMCAGKVLFHNGKYLTMDYPSLLDEVRKVAAWIMSLS